MTITLATFVKNEENCIAGMIASVHKYVDELVVVDTGSTDMTVQHVHELCQSLKLPYRIYSTSFTNFGDMRTKTAHLATKDWVLMLDADERLSNPELLEGVIAQGHDAYAFPRRRWLDVKMKKQTELEAYPDWQVRLFKNDKKYVWKRELHEYFHGAAVHHIEAGPVIEHFQDVYSVGDKLLAKQALYKKLAPIAKVTIDGGKPL